MRTGNFSPLPTLLPLSRKFDFNIFESNKHFDRRRREKKRERKKGGKFRHGVSSRKFNRSWMIIIIIIITVNYYYYYSQLFFDVSFFLISIFSIWFFYNCEWTFCRFNHSSVIHPLEIMSTHKHGGGKKEEKGIKRKDEEMGKRIEISRNFFPFFFFGKIFTLEHTRKPTIIIFPSKSLNQGCHTHTHTHALTHPSITNQNVSHS